MVEFVDKRVLYGIVIVALLGVGYFGFRVLQPNEPEVPDNGGETPNGGGETPDTGGETPDTGGEPDNETIIIGALSGTVKDDSGNPIQGVVVMIGELSAISGADGKYSLEVPEGEYYIEASKSSYSKGIKSLSVTETTEYTADFTLRKLSTGTGEGKTLRIITRHGSDIMRVAETLFLESDFAIEHSINNIEWLPVGASLWVDTIERSADIDVAWGGGPVLFDNLIAAGQLEPLATQNVLAIIDGIPEEIGGSVTRREIDGVVYWSGAAISSFGFTVNTELLDYYGLPEPTTWNDLTSTVYAAYLPTKLVGTADATKSTSNTRMFTIILQIYGWEEGWDLLIKMGANSKIFDQSGNVQDAVINKEIAVGTTIDFYGYTAQWVNPEFCKYIFPADGTIVNADPIAVLNTAKYPEEAMGFVEWVLSPEGQKVWLDGNINRLPINEAVFDTPEGKSRADLEAVYAQTQSALTVEFSDEEAASYETAMQYFYHAVIVRPQTKLDEVWDEMTLKLDEGEITQAQFDDLSFKLGNPLLFEFVDPETGQTETFTLEYAQSVNARIAADVEYKTRMVDAWIAGANKHYEDIAAELASIG